MGKKRGRPMKSREAKAADGANVVEIFDGAPETKEIPVDVVPPAYLSPLARAHFVELARLLKGMGLATAEDVHAIAGAAMWYGIMRLTYAKLKKIEGIVQATKTGYTQVTGFMSAFAAAENEWNARLTQFGLNPQARAALHKPGGSEEEGDNFLSGKTSPKAKTGG